MSDPTEEVRREMVAEINAQPGSREYLEARHGQVWTTSELSDDFEVIGFMAPVVVVTRKSDNQKGSLYFQHSPRFYYGADPATHLRWAVWEAWAMWSTSPRHDFNPFFPECAP